MPGLKSMFGDAVEKIIAPRTTKKLKTSSYSEDRVGSPNLKDAAKQIKKRKDALKKQLEELDK